MAFMEWTEECSVGVRQLDDDHKQLFSITNELYDSVVVGNGANIDDFLSNAISRLNGYIDLHFKREEDMLERNGYPKARSHKALHGVATTMFAQLERDKLHADKHQLAMEIVKLAKGWLLLHIQEEDKQLGAFLNSKGIR